MISELAVAYADTKAADLTWTLAGERRPSLASVVLPLSERRTLGLHVVGSSHQVLLAVDGFELVETVACPAAPSDLTAGLPAHARRDLKVGAYEFSSHVTRHSSFELARHVDAVCDQLRRRADAVVARFPGSAEAITALACENTATSAGWRTWHSYPQTGELVVTSSQVCW